MSTSHKEESASGALDETLAPEENSRAHTQGTAGGGDAWAATLDAARHRDSSPSPSLQDAANTSGSELALVATLDGVPNLPSATSADFPVGRWDRYDFVKLLGRGGMGAVYLARDRRLGRDVALKFIRSGDPNLALRFLQEARAQARIDHPNVCKVYEVGEVERQSYIAMQYVYGSSLDKAQSAMSLMEKVVLIRTVAEAMHEAHKLGIVHRDIKPSNIMVERSVDGTWTPIIMDFGLARESSVDHGLTESGAVLGTPAYMAPEQARGEVRIIDRRSDVYSLGATLYELISGKPPFSAASVVDLLLKVVTEEVPPLRTLLPSVPPDLETVVMKCLSREQNQRYDSAKALADDLGRYLGGEPILGRRVSLAYRLRRSARKHWALVSVVAVASVVLLGVGGYFLRERAIAKHERSRLEAQARLERDLAQQIKDMEWLLRSARQLPLHDLGREKAIVRKRMAQLESEVTSLDAKVGQALAHYALGRGHMALQEYPAALTELQRAIDLGYQSAEVHYARGVVLGQLFEQAISEIRMSGGGEWAKRRVSELEQKYLTLAVESLQRSRSMKLDAPQFLEGLIASYRRDYTTALQQADAALQQAPWLYEASRLAGNVHFARALLARDQGRYAEAEQEFQAAVHRLEEAAAAGQSDALVYEDLAEVWVRQIEMAALRGQPAEAAYQQAVLYSHKLARAEPTEIAAPLKRAFAAMMTVGVMGNNRGTDARMSECLAASESALRLREDNPYAAYTRAMCTLLSSELARVQGKDPLPIIRDAVARLQSLVGRHPSFLWGLNDLASAYYSLGHDLITKGEESAKVTLENALRYYSKAAVLDPQYVNAVGNALAVYAEIVQLPASAAERGTWQQSAETLYQQCTKINASVPLCHINYATFMARTAQIQQTQGQDPRPSLRVAMDTLALNRKVGGNPLELEQVSALVHLVDARDRLYRDSDPTPALQELSAALGRCHKIAAQDATCWTLAARRDWIEADWLGRRRQATNSVLLQALEHARQATASAEQTAEAWQSLAESHARLAQLPASRPAVRNEQIASGLNAVEHVFSLNAHHARGYATKGVLLFLQAETSRRGDERLATTRAAIAALDVALKQDPQLGIEYGPLLAQARKAVSQ